MREFKDAGSNDIIAAVRKLVVDQTLAVDQQVSIVKYFDAALDRLDNGSGASMRAIEIYRRLNELLEKDEVEYWQVLRVACKHCRPKSFGYPSWAAPPKTRKATERQKKHVRKLRVVLGEPSILQEMALKRALDPLAGRGRVALGQQMNYSMRGTLSAGNLSIASHTVLTDAVGYILSLLLPAHSS